MALAPLLLRPNIRRLPTVADSEKNLRRGSPSRLCNVHLYVTPLENSPSSAKVFGRSSFLNDDFISSGGVIRRPLSPISVSPKPRPRHAEAIPIASRIFDFPVPLPPINRLTRPNSSASSRRVLNRVTFSFSSMANAFPNPCIYASSTIWHLLGQREGGLPCLSYLYPIPR